MASVSDIAEGTVINPNNSNSDSFWIKRFLHKSSAVLVYMYVDGCIMLSPDQKLVYMFVNTLKYGPERFVFTDEGSLDKYLGVEIERLPHNTGLTMTQSFLIKGILEAANVDLRMTNSRPTPAVGPLLSRDKDGPDKKEHKWEYRNFDRNAWLFARHLKARHIYGHTSMCTL